jgi:hypothetical protein
VGFIDVGQALGSLGVVGLGVSRLYLPGSLFFPPSPINWRWVWDEAKVVCSWVATGSGCCMRCWSCATRTSCIQVTLKKEKKILPVCLWLPPCSFISSCVLSLQLLSRGSVDVPTLLAEVTWDWEAITAARATRVVAVVSVETSAQEAATVWDSAALHVKDVEDRATLAERVALERVLRVETENAAALASASEDAKGFVRKIALLEGKLVAECPA